MKKLLSLLLLIAIMVPMIAVPAMAEEVTEPETVTGVLNFDTTTAGWGTVSKVFCHIWAYNGDAFAKWQSKKEACTDTDKDGIWTYDLGAKGFELEVGKLYAVIFSSGNYQTYDLLFDSTVLGDTAYCDDTVYENPEDSTKTAQAAFWRNQDAAVFGPEKKITSIGNVVGTCVPNITTTQGIFETYIADPVKLENVRTFSLKEDQAIVDDIANGLGLTKEDVATAIANTGAEVAWTAENSTIINTPEVPTETEAPAPTETEAPEVPTETEAPAPTETEAPEVPTETEAPAPTETEAPVPTETEAPVPTETEAPTPTEAPEPETVTGVLNFDTNVSGWTDFTKVYCHIWAYNGDAFAQWQSKKEACADTDGDGIWTYDLEAKGFELEVGKLYVVIFSNNNGTQIYDLLFDSTVLGDTAYGEDFEYENPEDSTKKAQAGFWKGQDPAVFGPEKKITSIGNVVGTCIPNITTAQEMFETFLADTEKLDNVRTFSLKEDQAILDDIAKGLGLTKEDVEEAIAKTGADVAWTAENSTIGAEPEFLLGDVNGDGVIDIIDATLIQMHAAKLDTLTEEELKRADTTKDGAVDVVDASRIQQLVAKLITEF